jgi:hypothetical protein
MSARHLPFVPRWTGELTAEQRRALTSYCDSHFAHAARACTWGTYSLKHAWQHEPGAFYCKHEDFGRPLAVGVTSEPVHAGKGSSSVAWAPRGVVAAAAGGRRTALLGREATQPSKKTELCSGFRLNGNATARSRVTTFVQMIVEAK